MQNTVNGFRTAAVQCSDAKWRTQQGVTANRNAFGPLTNLPDFTYLDGRPTPLGVGWTFIACDVIVLLIVPINNFALYLSFKLFYFIQSRQRKRVLQQRETAKRIVSLNKELDMAKERLPILKRELHEKREQELSLKLKPKGYKMLWIVLNSRI